MFKTASMVGAPDLETPTLAPYSADLETAFQKLHHLGYDGVELMIRRPSRLDPQQLAASLRANHLELVSLCTGHVFGEEGLGLLLPDLTINPLAVDRLKEFIDYSADHFESKAMVNIGRSRGVGNPADLPHTLEVAREAIRELADYALPKNVRLILEPISRLEVNYIHSTEDGLALARLVDRSNFGLMVDTYHMALEDADLFQSFYSAASYIWHVHFSDSNRCYPGSGEIDFDRVLRVLEDIHYTGYLSVEIKPWPDPDTAAQRSIETMHRVVSPGN